MLKLRAALGQAQGGPSQTSAFKSLELAFSSQQKEISQMLSDLQGFALLAMQVALSFKTFALEVERLGLTTSSECSDGANALRRSAEELWGRWKFKPCPPPVKRFPVSTGRRHVPHERVKKLWRVAAAFVQRFISMKGSSRLKPNERVIALRVKELCDQYTSDFDNSEIGVYEAIALAARRCEVEAKVHELTRSDLHQHTRPPATHASATAKRMHRSHRLHAGHPPSSPGDETLEEEMRKLYDQAFKAAGGQQAAEARFNEVNMMIGKFRRGRVQQDAGFEIMGLDALYKVNRLWLDKFQDEVTSLAARTKGSAIVPPLKGYDRARAKVMTKYGNDTSCVTDVMRASLIYNTIDDLYDALVLILKEYMHGGRYDLRLVEVNDRFQHCKDGYRDVSLLLEVNGLVAEVQLHVKEILEAKKSGGHSHYRLQRMVNELLFEVCVRNSERDVVALLRECKNAAQGTRDKNGRGAIHYACQHDSVISTRLLLQHRADPWLEDDQGILPFELALKSAAFDCLELILGRMTQETPKNRNVLLRISQNAMPWWCDNALRTRMAGAVASIERWIQAGSGMLQVLQRYHGEAPLQELIKASLKHNEVERVQTYLQTGLDVKCSGKQDSLADLAARAGQIEMVKMLQVFARMGRRCCQLNKESGHGHLRAAALKEDSNYATAALIAGAHPDHESAKCPGKRTPLMAFAAAGDLDMCKLLVEYHAQVHWLDSFFCSALHYARALEHFVVVEYLKSLKVPVEAPLRKITHQRDVLNYLQQAIHEGCCGAVTRAAIAIANLGDLQELLAERVGPFKLSLLHISVQALNIDPAGQVLKALLILKADPHCEPFSSDNNLLRIVASKGNSRVYSALVKAAYEHPVEAPEELETLINETRTYLDRHQERAEALMLQRANRDPDTIMWLEIGFAAFRQCLLFSRLGSKRFSEDPWLTIVEGLKATHRREGDTVLSVISPKLSVKVPHEAPKPEPAALSPKLPIKQPFSAEKHRAAASRKKASS